MLTFYLCFLAGGAVLPFISFLFSFLGDGLDTDVSPDVDVNADISIDGGTDLDIHSDVDLGIGVDSVFTLGLLPTSLMSLSALAITFGTAGALMTYGNKGKTITFIAAISLGYLASVIVQTIIKTLKKVQTRNYGVDEYELLLYDGKIVDTILPGQLGSVSFNTLSNVKVTYPAKCVDTAARLESGKIVKAKEIVNGIFIVEVKNKYE